MVVASLNIEETFKSSVAEYLNLFFCILAAVMFLDLSAINAVAVLDLCGYKNFSKFPLLTKWIAEVKKLPYYDECTGNPAKEIAILYQEKLKA